MDSTTILPRDGDEGRCDIRRCHGVTQRTQDVGCLVLPDRSRRRPGNIRSVHKQGPEEITGNVGKGQEQDSRTCSAKLTTLVNGKRHFISAPPLVVRLRDLAGGSGDDVQRVLDKGWADYVGNQDEDRRRLLERFRITDAALRVGGVGSVGTRCTVALLEEGADDDAIILQRKEAGKSVLEAHLGNSGHENPAQRIVHGQRLMQASSDIFLGWHMGGFNEAHYYWRQLHDMKGSFDIAAFHKGGFEAYVEACGGCLARAHGRGGDAASISGYVGKGGALADAIADFAVTYAHQTERDHRP